MLFTRVTPETLLADLTGNPMARTAIALAIAIVVAVILTGVLGAAVRWVGKRRDCPTTSIRRMRIPFRVLAIVVGSWIAVEASLPRVDGDVPVVARLFLIATIASAAWLICAILLFLLDLALARYRVDGPDNRVARRIRTQVLILRRLAVVIVVVLAAGAILLTFPGAQAAGASVLASAGLVSIVAGLAAQSTLANVFAGMQLAFSDAIRVDDVVIVETEWGRIEEITLTYVVVHIWDDRRMVLPSTYFTSTPFQNWTRRNSELLGSVEFDLDWRVTPAEMRDEMHRILDRSELWDKRVAVLQVTDAVGGYVRVRILVTAIDAPTLFDLRCYLREELVTWLHQASPQSIPRQRVQLVEAEVAPRRRAGQLAAPASGDRSLFSGEDAADAKRGNQFTGPISTLDAAELARYTARDRQPRGDNS